MVFHVQTEDSGLARPWVTTHLFADGGRILCTKRVSYAEHRDDPLVAERVCSMMRGQHGAMLIALRAGELDAALKELASEQALPSEAITARPSSPSKARRAGPPLRIAATRPAPSLRGEAQGERRATTCAALLDDETLRALLEPR